jgi:hypothetical protein
MNSKRKLPMSDTAVGPTFVGQPVINVRLAADRGLFFEVADQGWATYFEDLKAPFQVQVSERVPINCMFDVNWLTMDGRRVGLLFRSTFQVKNGGGYLVAFMNQARGKAQTVDVLLKTDDLVIYNYPNKGTMVVLTQIGPEVQTVFEEQ